MHLGGFGRIWQNLVKFGRIWQNLAEFGKIWQNFGEFGRIWENLGEFGRIWENLGGFGRIWKDLGGFGKAWNPRGAWRKPGESLGGAPGDPQPREQLRVHTLGFPSYYTIRGCTTLRGKGYPRRRTTLRGGFPPLRDLGNLLKALVLRMDFGERGRGQPPPSFFRV